MLLGAHIVNDLHIVAWIVSSEKQSWKILSSHWKQEEKPAFRYMNTDVFVGVKSVTHKPEDNI